MRTTTVRKLIAELKKMPQGAVVVWKDHDHASEEYNAKVHFVTEGENDLCDALGEPHGNVVALSG